MMLWKMRWRMMMSRMAMSRERKMMMLMLRRRKMMMLRRTRLRRKTDPESGTHSLCEPAQSKCTSAFHKGHSIQKFTGKMPRPKATAHTLHEPAQSKRTSTCHKSHFIEKMPRSSPERRHTLRASLCSRNAFQHFTRPSPDQAPAFTITARTPQSGHTVWGNNSIHLHSAFSRLP